MPCPRIRKCNLKPPTRCDFEAVALIVRYDSSSQDVGRKKG
jgi:hypothetical protein